ncbi:PAS domain S-box protein [Stappia stellulata]|uniref:two-component system sensor histidine kinase NtrB n=1 Tax=Stappia stellulata TaxID=71235 RepID=UPI001CD7D2FF|nr:PAS domain S-box protein [Stappia stellulata]MCA1243586.1 PAS domain S-box protein [Stappia stellulata]
MREDHSRSMSVSPSVSEARLASVLGTAVDGIVVMDDAARIILFNKACETLFGYSAEEVRGKNVKMLMPADYAHEHDGYLSHYLETGEKRIIGIGREVRGRHSDGTEFPIELSVGEAATPEGRQFIGIMRDLRPRKAVERRLAEAQAQLVNMTRISALDEMGAAIAHELNQPLTAIMLYLQAARRKASAGGAPDEKLVEIVDKGVREAERASQIIQRMRGFVEKRDPERRPVSMASLIRECLELVVLGDAHSGVKIFAEIPDDLPEISADPVQIQQVLVNLARNALEAVRECKHKVVRVRAFTEGPDMIVSVSDSGGGVPPEVVPNLFRAFSGVKRRGLGLGLTISRSIAQNHGGDLSVEPLGEDGGAVFVLRLPLDARAEETPAPAVSLTKGPSE